MGESGYRRIGNAHNTHSVAVCKTIDGEIKTVGHIPQKTSAICLIFIRRVAQFCALTKDTIDTHRSHCYTCLMLQKQEKLVKKLSELVVICQIHQTFLLPKFFTVWYANKTLLANNTHHTITFSLQCVE